MITNPTDIFRIRTLVVVCLTHLMLAPVALSAAVEPDSTALEEIIVTAQKREQNLQNIGISVTALESEALQLLGHQDLTAMAQQVPSLLVLQYSPTTTVLNIRGVSQNDFSDVQEAPITFYNDEVYISALGAITGQSFDLQRIEVLRGPQGTLFGRNATGGLVQVVTAKPTRELSGYLTLTTGRFGQLSGEGAISGTIINGLRGRLSFTTDRHDGYIRNLTGPDIGSADNYGIRAQLEADVGDNGKLGLKLEQLRNVNETSGTYTHESAGYDADGLGYKLAPTENFWGTCPGCDALGYRASDDPFIASQDKTGRFDRNFWSLTARYEHQLGFATLTSISNYQHLEKHNSEDSDASPNPFLSDEANQKVKQWSEELRLNGSADRLDWVAGANALSIDSDASIDLHVFADTLSAVYPLKTRSYAAFGQAEYRLNNLISVTAGGRYSHDQKTDNLTHLTNGSPDFTFNTTTFPDLARKTFASFSGKLQLDARPREGTLLYLSVNRGTKSGGFGVPTFPPFDASRLPFDQEVLTNYEGGFKLSLAHKRIDFNGAFFRYNYQNYQAFAAMSFSQFLLNKPATVTGAEFEVSARPLPELHVSAYATRLFTARVEDITLPLTERSVSRRLPQAPNWSGGVTIDYEIPIGAGTLGILTNWRYNGQMYFSTFNAPIDREPSYAVGNARLSYSWANSRWEAALFVNNLADKHFRVYSADLGSVAGLGESVYAQPRWYGGTLTFRL